jgi:hypothetical protein
MAQGQRAVARLRDEPGPAAPVPADRHVRRVPRGVPHRPGADGRGRRMDTREHCAQARGARKRKPSRCEPAHGRALQTRHEVVQLERRQRARYWLERGWQASWSTTGGFLPTADADAHVRLPEKERRILEPVLFDAGTTRRITAEVLAGANGARSHADLCDALATSSKLSNMLGPKLLAPLPAFSRFADAAMVAMRGLWSEINHDDMQQAPAIERLAKSAELRSKLGQLRAAGHTWLNTPTRSEFPHEQAVTLLAEAMRGARTPVEQLRALARHHHAHGGRRRWFREQAGKLVPLVADSGIAASDYRFRLRPLCRLAAQCSVANMSRALDAVAQQGADDEEGENS